MSSKKHGKRKNNSKTSAKKIRIQRVDAYYEIKGDQKAELVFSVNSSGFPEVRANGIELPLARANSELYYEREFKPKIITRSAFPCPLYGNASLSLRKYSHLCVVDTNSRRLHDRILSVSFLFLGHWNHAEDGIKFNFYPYLYMDFMDCDEKPERFAWREVIRLLVNGPDYADNHNTFGIIVDSDLNAISAINNREESVYSHFFMPERIELVYATADKADTVQNAMVRECDKYATQRIKRFEEVYKSEMDMKKFPMYYQNIRRIELDLEQPG